LGLSWDVVGLFILFSWPFVPFYPVRIVFGFPLLF